MSHNVRTESQRLRTFNIVSCVRVWNTLLTQKLTISKGGLFLKYRNVGIDQKEKNRKRSTRRIENESKLHAVFELCLINSILLRLIQLRNFRFREKANINGSSLNNVKPE